jgi:hypothetical protein
MNLRVMNKTRSHGTRGYYRVFAHRRKLRVNVHPPTAAQLRRYPENLASRSPHFLPTHTPDRSAATNTDNPFLRAPLLHSMDVSESTSVMARIRSLLNNSLLVIPGR